MDIHLPPLETRLTIDRGEEGKKIINLFKYAGLQTISRLEGINDLSAVTVGWENNLGRVTILFCTSSKCERQMSCLNPKQTTPHTQLLNIFKGWDQPRWQRELITLLGQWVTADSTMKCIVFFLFFFLFLHLTAVTCALNLFQQWFRLLADVSYACSGERNFYSHLFPAAD